MNTGTRQPRPSATRSSGPASGPPSTKTAIGIDVSRRGPILVALEAVAERVREQPWPGSSRGKALQESARYDHRRAAKQMLEDFGKAAAVAKKHHATFARSAEALAAHLPESLEDVDGAIVLAWLERELPIQWNDDQLAVPEAARETFTALIEATLARAERGALASEVAHKLATSIAALLPPAAAKKDAEARVRHIEKPLVEIMSTWLWRCKGREREVALEVMDSLGRVLKLQWIPLPRPERPYSPTQHFEVGDVVVHAKFGRGTVLAGTDTSIEVIFTDGARKLGAARSSSSSD